MNLWKMNIDTMCPLLGITDNSKKMNIFLYKYPFSHNLNDLVITQPTHG
jgi:hypothetical protein